MYVNKNGKVKLTVYIPVDTYNDLKDYCYCSYGRNLFLSSVVNRSILNYLSAEKRRQNSSEK